MSGRGFASLIKVLAAMAVVGLLTAGVLSGCGSDSGTTTNATTLSERPGMSQPGEKRAAEEAKEAKEAKEAGKAEGKAGAKEEGAAKEAAPGTAKEGESSGNAAQLTEGKSIFTTNCSGCHTLADANATGEVGPNLDQLKPEYAIAVHQVENGGGPMPPFKGTLQPSEIEAVAKYVSTVAGKG